MGNVSGYVLQGAEKTLYIAGDTIYFDGVEKTLLQYHPDVILLNCCEATIPEGRLIMNLAEIEKVCKKEPNALVIATHLDSVNHARITRKEVQNFIKEKGLTQVRVPLNGDLLEW